MSLFLAFILGLVAWYIFKGAIAVMNARRKAQEFFSQFNNTARGAYEEQRRGGWSTTKRSRRKKIDPEVGEYVAFEEVSDSGSESHAKTDGGSRSRDEYKNESQITDAEWEDI